MITTKSPILEDLYANKSSYLADVPEFKKRLFFLYLRKKVEEAILNAIFGITNLTNTYPIKRDQLTLTSAATLLIKETFDDEDEVILNTYNRTIEVDSVLTFLTYNSGAEGNRETFKNKIQQQLRSLTFEKFEDEVYFDDKLVYTIIQCDDDQIYNAMNGSSREELDAIKRIYHAPYAINAIPEFKKNLSDKNQIMPITHFLKELRILEAGFVNDIRLPSKVSFIQHDLLDHANTFYELINVIEKAQKNGRHESFFNCLGHPFKKTHMNREGELIAAISYACRQYYWCKQFSQETLCSINIQEFKNEYNISSNAPNALLSHVLCNCIIQAEELQIKYGMPYSLDQNNNIVGRFDPLSPAYIEFIFDVASILDSCYSNPGNCMPENLAFRAEDYFCELYGPLVVNSELSLECKKLITSNNNNYSRIPREVKQYIITNCHFAASPKSPDLYSKPRDIIALGS